MDYIEKEIVAKIAVITIDRLGRYIRYIKHLVLFKSKKIPVCFINQNLTTINDDGTENPISKLIISILATVSEMERNQIRERQLEGIKLAKARGVYTGRKKGTTEDTLTFLSKPKNRQAVEYLKRGMSNKEAAKLAGLHINTLTKIKKQSKL